MFSAALAAFVSLAFAQAPEAAAASMEEGTFQLDMVTLDMLRTSCEGGDKTACHRLGRRYEQGIGGAKVSYADAATWYRKGCDAGVVMDCGLAALSLAHISDASSYTLAKKGCDAGDTMACYVLGHDQIIGLGTTADTTGGFKRVEKACADGIPPACAELGLLLSGAVPGLATDYPRAKPLLEAGCAEDDINACSWLGAILLAGKIGPVDWPKASGYLEKGCAANNGVACESLGAAWLQGLGVTADAKKSVPYFRKACDAKVATSCAQLATMTLQGQGGIPADRAKALVHLRNACTYGLPAACQELDSACRSGATDACGR